MQLALIALMVSQTVNAQPLDKIVAVINDNVITNQELDSQLSLVEKQLQQRHVKKPEPAIFKKQVLQHMIDVELQLQMVKSHGIEISYDQVSDSIKNIAKQNKISIASMKKSILAQGITWSKYRADIKKEILLSKLQQQSIAQVVVTDNQVNDYLNSHQQQSNLQYHLKDILLPLVDGPSPEQLKKANLTANELINKLKNGLDFSQAAVELSSGNVALKGGDLGMRSLAALPKMFAELAVSMKKNEIAGPIRASNGLHIIKLVAISGEAKKQIVTLTHVKHILLKSEIGLSDKQNKAKIIRLESKLKSGQSFESLAKKYSADKISAKQGGSLGWLHKGETVPEFERAFEGLKVGQISQAIKTPYGWHLIKVIARKKIDDSKSFQKQRVKQELYQRKFTEAVNHWLQQLRANSYVKVTI